MKKFPLLSLIVFGLHLNAQIATSTPIENTESKWTFGGSAGLVDRLEVAVAELPFIFRPELATN